MPQNATTQPQSSSELPYEAIDLTVSGNRIIVSFTSAAVATRAKEDALSIGLDATAEAHQLILQY